MTSAIFPAKKSSLLPISELVRSFAEELGFSSKQLYEIDLAVDEACSNIIDHAYPSATEEEFVVKLSTNKDGMTILLEDHGLPFDPEDVPPPDLDSPLEQRRERGLGVYLIRQLMDEVAYERIDQLTNRLTLVKRFKSSDPEEDSPEEDTQNQTEESDSLPIETLRIISEFNRSISSTLELDQLLAKVAGLIHSEFSYPFVHIFILDYVSQSLVYKAGSGSRAAYYEQNKISFPVPSQTGLISLTAQTGKFQLSNDVSKHDRFKPDSLTGSRAGSELSLPLQFGGELLGVLDLQSDQVNAFSAEDIELLETLSLTIASALRNANLYKSAQWRRNLAETYREIAELISENLELDHLINTILAKLPNLLPVDFIGVWLPEEDGNAMELKYKWSAKPTSNLVPEALKANPAVWFAGADCKSLSLFKPKAPFTDPLVELLELPDDFSAIAGAICNHDLFYGVISMHVASAGRYGEDSLNICSTFADYIANAMEKQRLEEEKQNQAWLTSILLDLALETKNLTSIEELTDKIGEILLELIGGKSVALALETENPSILTLPNLYCPGTICPIGSLPLDLDRQTLVGNIKTGEVLSAAPLKSFPALLSLFPQLTGESTLLTFPLRIQEQTLGFLLHLSDEPYQQVPPESVLDQQRLAILNGVAQQAAISLQNILMLQEKQEESRISKQLLELGNLFVQTKNIQEAVSNTCYRIFSESGISSLVLLILDQQEQEYIVHDLLSCVQLNESFENSVGLAFSEEKIRTLLENPTSSGPEKRPGNLVSKLISTQPNHAQSSSDCTQIFSLDIGIEHYGFLLAVDKEYEFSYKKIDFLKRASYQIAIGLQNDRLKQIELKRKETEQELGLARRIQKTFLPEKLPEIPGYQLAVDWNTARQVGGDFYDVIPLSPTKFGLIIADVSDKGLAASLYMTVSRTLLRAVSQEFTSPARALERVNQLLQLDSSQSFFVTLIYLILDTATGELSYCIAGHNPPYLLDSATNSAQKLNMGGIALGLLDPIKLSDEFLQLKSGQSLFLYTDGISEPANEDGLQFGSLHLPKCLELNAGKEPEIVISAVKKELNAYLQGRPIEDDYTMLVLKRNDLLTD